MTNENAIFAAALVKAQMAMGNAKKDSTNPFFKSKYADLNSIREVALPSLNENGIAVLQPVIQKDGKSYVRTTLIHESGKTWEIADSDVEILFSKPNDPQAQGSGLTYARRYSMQSLLNIGAEDDDGNNASKKRKEFADEMDQDMAEMCFNYLESEINNVGTLEDLEELKEKQAFKQSLSKLKKKNADLYSDLIAKAQETKESFEAVEGEEL